MLSWDDLRYVLAVARAGTLSKAAEALQVNHSTVSRRLAALSEQLGVRLFEKLPDGYEPTAAGLDVVRVAERVEEEMLSLEGRVLGRDAELRGSLRVTTTDQLARRFMPELGAFVRRYPHIALELSADYAPMSLTRREADVAIRLTNAPPEHLVGRKVARLEFALYASRALVEELGEGASLGDYPWLAWEERAGAVLTERWMTEHVPDARVVCRLDSAIVMAAGVAAGMGVAFLTCLDGDADPGLVRLRAPEPGFGMDLWVLTHEDLRGSARVRAFTDYAADVFSRHADVLSGDRSEAPVEP